MKDIEISVVRETRIVNLNKKTIGNDGENLQGNLIFRFEDTFVNGQARLEYSIDDTKEYVMLTKIKDYYTIPIKSVMTKYGKIFMQLVITEGTNSNEIPIFKSNVFYLFCDNSINAEIEQPSEYPLWIDIANTKLNSVDEALEKSKSATEHAQKQGDYAKEQGDYAKNTAADTKNKADEGYFDGKSLEFIWRGTELGIRVEGNTEYKFVDLQGVQGIKGDTGEPFKIKKTYPSVQAMNDDFNNMEFGDYVMIASSVQEEDNAKLYTRGEYKWIFITDFSGAMGIRGPVGKTPQISVGNVATIEPNESASVTISGTDENPVFNFSLPRGKTGDKGDKGDKGDTGATGNGIQDISKVSSEGLVDTYQINYTDGTNTNFEVTNGEDGNVLQQEEIDKLNANIDQLESILPQKTATGTNTLEYKNAKGYKLFKGEYEGKEYQETREGYNLLSMIKTGSSNSSLVNGNLVFDFSVNQDTFANLFFKKVVGKDYTVIFDGSGLLDDESVFFTVDGSGTKAFSFKNGKNVWAMTAIRDNGRFTIDDITRNNINSIITLSNIMILEGTYSEETIPHYEEFGTCPSPDYFSEVETLKGYNLWDDNSTSRNLIDYDSATRTYSSKDNDTATSLSYKIQQYADDIFLRESQVVSSKITSLGRIYLKSKRVESSTTIRIGNSGVISEFRLLLPFPDDIKVGDDFVVSFDIIDMTIGTSKIKDIMLYKGNDERPYLPYGSIGIKRHKKNIFKLLTRNITINGLDFNINEDGTINVNGTATETTYFTLNDKRQLIEKGKYKIVGCPRGGTNKYRLNCSYYNFDNVYINGTSDWGDGTLLYYEKDNILITITIIINSGVTVNNLVFKPMMSPDLTVTYDDYEPYFERIDNIDLKGHEVLSKDKIVVDKKGNVDLIKNWKKHIFDGNEDWNISNFGNMYRANITLTNAKIFSTNNANLKSNCFYGDTHVFNANTIENGQMGQYKNSQSFYFGTDKNSTDFIQFLKDMYNAGTPVYLIYEPVEPEIIHLGTIEPIESLEGYNYVEVLASLPCSSMQETYVNDLSKEIEDLKNTIVSASL